MKSKVLVIYYSQTGQLKDIAQNLVQPFEDDEKYDLDYYNIKPVKDFPFPWDIPSFYGAFPETYQQIPIALVPPSADILQKDYDLVIIAYQVWFLTPAIPINSFMKSEYAETILKGKKVITIIGARNMWAKAQQKMKLLIHNVGADLVGNIALVDRHLNHISVITIFHWMLGGKKTKKFGIFPRPGVSDEDIDGATKFGEIIKQAQEHNDFENLQSKIIQAGGVKLKPFIVFMDEKANKMFNVWSKFILKSTKNRALKLNFFKVYLMTTIWILSPIVYILYLITYPLRIKQIREKNKFYCEVK